ncbi:MAG TPA: hypothetical protein VM183_18815 [Burkholderiales bacterium]|nr:hypothetical protein [Burkholderiales bacterium]
MSLAGEGVVAIWNGIRPEGRAEFYEWHSREHMPERVAIPGFLRGRRYIAAQAQPEFFTLYETVSVSVLSGPDYLARLNSPTEWTRRATQHFTDTSRSLCRVAVSLGPGAGGWLMTWRYEQPQPIEPILREIAEAPGVVGAHLCIADRTASGIETEEKKGRPKNAVPAFVILVEGGADRDTLEAACARISIPGAERGLYRLQYVQTK